MSIASDNEAVAPEWTKVNFLDLFPLSDDDLLLDTVDNQPLFDNEFISLPQVADDPIDQQRIPGMVHPRQPWGHGRDALRCMRFRNYPAAASPIFHCLSQGKSEITKPTLQTFIDLCIASCPEDMRPKPPTRSQKRVKAGLVYWLDENALCVMRYLTSLSTGNKDSV
jgi:hypothetical protein